MTPRHDPLPLEADELAIYDDGDYDGDLDADRIELAATGHLLSVTRDPDGPDTTWAVSIGSGEGPGMVLVRMSERQPADLLLTDLRNALQYVVEHPAGGRRHSPRTRTEPAA